MAKGKNIKKRNLKLRRQLRKTLGCLFLASAIIVTAIPVQPTEAADTPFPVTKVMVLNQKEKFGKWEELPSTAVRGFESQVPYVEDTEIIYTTGDTKFRFAYIKPTTTSVDEVAVILGYMNIGSLENNTLTIPDTVDAYRKYTTNTTAGEACAVSRSNEFLFYKVTEQVPLKDTDGNIIYNESEEMLIQESVYNSNTTKYKLTGRISTAPGFIYVIEIYYDKPKMEDVVSYRPCYYSTRESWDKDAAGNKIFEENELYYYAKTDVNHENPILTTEKEHQRIHDAVVAYIGNQKVIAKPSTSDIDSEWIAGLPAGPANPERGIFAGINNIVSLKLGKNLMGVGDFAFYNCTGLSTVTLNNGLNTIGNGAFAGCINMTTCNIDVTANIQAIGHHAFYNCVALTSFAVPTGLIGLGDSAFEGCSAMTDIDLGNNRNIALQIIGDKVFNGCKSLKNITFPPQYTENLSVKLFDGCSSLKYIKAQNSTLKFADVKADIENFIKTVGEEFYFEADDVTFPDTGTPPFRSLHDITKKYGIAFKYLGQDIYEKVVIDKKQDGTINGTTTWKVNARNELIGFEQVGTVNNVEVPGRIGPYYIQRIGDNSFRGNYNLKKIIIPSSVTEIGNSAFLACYNLKDVIFMEPINLVSIGTDAFSTQKGVDASVTLPATPKLTFTGKIDNSSLPFKYAMTPTTTINYGTQPKTWITFYSGWPSNLTVQYNPSTDKKELIDYPRYSSLTDYTLDSYPYMTQTYMDEADKAVAKYEAYYDAAGNPKPGADKPTQYQEEIVNSALNIVLPAGIESIKEGIFSGKKTTGETIAVSTDPADPDDPDAPADPGDVAPVVNTRIKSITTNTVETIPPYGFAGCTGLTSFYMGGGSSVGDYAFDGCTGLRNVEIAPSVTAIGKRPFRGCITSGGSSGLTSISFPGSANFAYSNGIIYGKTGGVNTKIVECLETRGKLVGTTMVGPEELKNVKEIAPEAFMDCKYIGEVNLGTSSVVSIPEKCFAQTSAEGKETGNLYKVTLPDTAKEISAGAFWNSFVGNIIIPDSVVRIAADAFSNTKDNGKTFESYADHKPLLVITVNGSNAEYYTKDYSYMTADEDDSLKTKWSVMFFDAFDEVNPKIIDEQRIPSGTDATPPTPPVHEGYTFAYWFPTDVYKAVTRDVEVYARYTKNDATTYTVRFFDYSKKLMEEYTQQVEEGKDAVPPAADKMAVDGMVFTGWDRPYTKIMSPVDIYATYEVDDSNKFTVTFWADENMTVMIGKPQQVAAGESAIEPAHPAKEGHTFSGWFPASSWKSVAKDLDVIALFTAGSGNNNGGNNNGGNNNGGNNNGGNNNGGNNSGGNNSGGNNSGGNNSGSSVSGNSTKYTVKVNGGSGSGSYTAGTIVNINAYATSDGKVFDKWTSSSAGVGFVNASAVSTSFTMPANNVDITANTKTGRAASSVTGNSRNTLRNSVTTVDVTKGGISNTDLVSANVNGSSDNYVIRITEDAQATAAVIAALEARYGDISNIAYMPMDISLYDATGQTQITDISGITVDITLPLPDELIQYAGNNKAASVVNGELENLAAKFTTIDGVPCIQFTATHFSPYTIYVDKSNLTEGLIDSTPKTGDPIHPKWFLAMGLACVAVILFAKKDKGQSRVKSA